MISGSDKLFSQIADWQGGQPWASFLDAGTGSHSLSWIASLKTERWTAVTGSQQRCCELSQDFGGHMRPTDHIVVGNWADPGFLKGQKFETVLADYLLGALDGFAPYFQDQLFARLKNQVAGTLYVVGLEPWLEKPDSVGGRLIVNIGRLHDACLLLAERRCYREYPREWALRSLDAAGFDVEASAALPILYGPKYIRNQLAVARRQLPLFKDAALASAMGDFMESLEQQALALIARDGQIRFGSDYVIKARPRP